jgi:hypothetical protein
MKAAIIAVNRCASRVYGGDDGARTRDLCRDSEPKTRNLLESGGTDGHPKHPETPPETLIAPAIHLNPLPKRPLPDPSFY